MMSEPASPNNSLQQGNEWLKPVDPNEGERKWAQYAAASTPPRRSGVSSLVATPHSGSQLDRGPPPPIPMGESGPPRPNSNSPPATKEAPPQLWAQIEGKLVPVSVGSDGTIVPVRGRQSNSPHIEFESECGEKGFPAPIVPTHTHVWNSQFSHLEQQNAWLLLQQQQQLLFQLQQQQAITTAALAGIAARTQSSPEAWSPSILHPMHQTAEFGSDGSAFVTQSDCGLSGQGSTTVTPTMASDSKAPRASRQDALLTKLKNTTITLPPPPPPPAPEKPFTNTKRKGKLEALMNSLQYTDLLTPSYSGKGQTQSETGVVVETPDDDEITPMSAALGSAATPSSFSPGYKKKACRAYFSSTGCRHSEKCLFSHASPSDEL
ncbi:Hypothetical protein, putative [Bodo saltans]|uniref:C3H1-type domain-containing protein n=1 Tax=Bodo saltans TaxID=75058 RepID=A0A0S4IXS9_BODSA|nr:Hypothetical protein, putative [Bodo saltans]|eukprot:CUF64179.1 Hypothetical protein, putative [Bodo saltans]